MVRELRVRLRGLLSGRNRRAAAQGRRATRSFDCFSGVFLRGKFFGSWGNRVAWIGRCGRWHASDGVRACYVTAALAMEGRKWELQGGCEARRAGLISAWARG